MAASLAVANGTVCIGLNRHVKEVHRFRHHRVGVHSTNDDRARALLRLELEDSGWSYYVSAVDCYTGREVTIEVTRAEAYALHAARMAPARPRWPLAFEPLVGSAVSAG